MDSTGENYQNPTYCFNKLYKRYFPHKIGILFNPEQMK